jgi:2-polyprenyl-6-methoxyphenol hydroxylase-like FAD-dependent oxidoreductase
VRKLLIDALPPGTIEWGRKVTGVPRDRPRQARGDLRRRLDLDLDPARRADGAWSRVRPLLSAATPEYIGTSFVETYLFDADERHAASAKAVGAGALLANVPGKGIQAHREAGGVLHTYVALTKPQDWFARIDFTAARICRRVRRVGARAHRPDHRRRDPAGAADAPRPADRAPLGPGARGDPARRRHPPAPPNGEGANAAMFDGAQLAEAIAAHPDDVEAALTAYEQALFSRAAADATEAARDFDLCFGENAPRSLIDLLTGVA